MFSGMLGPATGSMMMSTPLPWVIFADALADHLALAIDGVIGTEIAGKARLLIAADHADHGEVGRLRHVNERVPHSACGCIHEHVLALLRPNGIVEDVIGDLIIGERRCGIEINAVRQDKGRLRRRRYIFRIMAAAMRSFARTGVDALTGLAGPYVPPDLCDRTGELGAGRCRKRRHPAVSAGTDQEVGDSHSDRMGADEDFVRFRLRDGYIEALQHVRWTRLTELDEPHVLYSSDKSETVGSSEETRGRASY